MNSHSKATAANTPATDYQARRAAEKAGFLAVKKIGNRSIGQNGFMLLENGACIAGSFYNMTADDVVAYCAKYGKGGAL